MQIIRLDRFAITIPLRHPMRMAGRTIATSDTIVVRLVTTGREPGWGEANVATQLTGETAASIGAALDAIEARLVGEDARDLRRLSEIMAALAPAATSARAAVDMALHDVVARSLGISLSRLLGGSETLDAPMIALIDFGVGDWIAECRERLAEGVRLIKFKVANAPVAEETALIRTAAEAIGGAAAIAVDANGGWTADEARAFCDALHDVPLLFIEQPLPPDQPVQAARLAMEVAVPLGADEAIRYPADIIRCATDSQAAGVALKLLKAGGIGALRDAAALAGSLSLAVNLSGKVGETSIANAATLHVASAVTQPRWGVSLTAAYLADDVVGQPLPLAGRPKVLAGPGLGIAVDERRLADLATAPAAAKQPEPNALRGVPAGASPPSTGVAW